MSLPDRHDANGTITVSRPDADSAANGGRAPRHCSALAVHSNSISPTSDNDRQRFLELACARGFLPAESIVAPEVRTFTDFRSIVSRVLAPNISNDLPAVPFVEPIEPCDADLDGPQREAVARAVYGPELLLIQGLPGTGKSRVIAEIIRQSISRGKRVLLTAPDCGAIDVVLQGVLSASRIMPVRLVGRTERPEEMPARIADLTPLVQERVQRTVWLEKAREIERAAVSRQERCRDVAATWASLLETADLSHGREREREMIRHQREAIPSEVRRTAEQIHPAANGSRLTDNLHNLERTTRERTTEFEKRRMQLQSERSLAEAELQKARTECESLRPLDEASHSGRFWSVTFWKAKLNKSLAVQLAGLVAQIEQIEHRLKELTGREEALNGEILQAENNARCDRLKLVDEEIQAALRILDERETELDRLDNEAREKFNGLCNALPVGTVVPLSLATDSIRSSQQTAAKDLSECQSEVDFARRWLEFVEADGNFLSRRWRSQVNLVAAPLSAIASDPWFSDSTEPFDLLIVDDAHRLTEGEILPAAKKVARWVLLGEPGPTARLPSALESRKPRTPPDFFARLWERLHHETWTREGDRICCRLNPLATFDRRRLETETVANRPEIELRIFSPVTGEPVLAEVVFPGSVKLAEALGYLSQELGEIPLPSRTRTARWEHHPECLIYRIGPVRALPLPAQCTVLVPGVMLRWHDRSEAIAQDEIAIHFDRLDGWDATRAEAWVQGSLRAHDTGRTCRLEKSYRHSPALASWLNEAVNCGCRYPVDQHAEGAIQFEPVPRRAPSGRRRGGAGLEIDLADPSQRELLPNELAATLPGQGYVNLPEAQAVADLLQRLPADRSIAVTAPYPAQVTVLRHYMKDRARVIPPSELIPCDCDVLIVSLTRSHVSRAVTYGNDPVVMLQLLARPRSRLVLVGDPGTLARRAQWEGAVEQFDESAGERERRWVNALLSVSHANGRPVRAVEGVKA